MGVTILRPGQRLIVPNVRVMQTSASAFLPTSLAGLLAWFDAQDAAVYTDSALTTLATANGTDVVGGWKDKSGNANHATQATLANKPIFFNNIIGGKNAVKADGSNDFLATASITHGIGTGDFYVAVVLKRHGTGASYRCIWGGSGGNFGTYVRGSTATIEAYLGAVNAFNTTLVTNTAYLVEFWRLSGTSKAAVNAVQESSTFSNSLNVTNSIFRLFSDPGASFSDIYLAELLFYSNFPSGRSSIQAYLNAKYTLY